MQPDAQHDAAPADRLDIPRDCSFLPEDWRILSRAWYPVARVEDIAERPVKAQLLDVRLVIYRAGGQIVVARDLCVHRGVPLSMGTIEGELIVCAYHGLKYGPDGLCRVIPAHEGAAISPRLRITVFPVVERYGLVWTSLNGHEPSLPPFEAWDDPEFQPIMNPTIDIAGSAGRQIEGFLDVAHFAWVHTESFADPYNAHVPSYKVERRSGSLHVEYASTVSNLPKALHHRAPPDFLWLRVFDAYPPFSARLTVHFPDGGRLWILNAASPMAAKRTRLFCPVARNFDKELPVEQVHAFNLQIFNEDRVFVEAQTPEDLPLDLQSEAHITADRTSIAYRNLLKSMGLGAAYTS